MNWDEIRKEYEVTKPTLSSLADKYNISLGTLKSRKSREGWGKDATKKDATKKDAEKKVATKKKKGAPIGNKNAKGNRGNKNASAPKQNTNAVKHGLFSKYIPKETLDIMNMLDEKSPADLIWDQIQIQYAAIIRAQEIMFVASKNEMIRELKKAKESGHGSEEEWELQFAWDRQANFLNAQSRAMSELRSSIKQFNDLAHDDDERKLKLQQMQINIDKTKAEVNRLNDNDTGEEFEVIIKRKGDDS